jgi:hypothetical protein
MEELLDQHVSRFERPGDWEDVLRRARVRRRPGRRMLAIAAVVLAAFIAAPALAVLLRDRGIHLPDAADKNNVVVILQPTTGRMLLEAAPWKGHDGFCYLVLEIRAGCVPRSGQTAVLWPPLFGWSFDRRVHSGTATTIAGRQLSLTVVHFGGRIDATLFLIRDRIPRFLRSVVLRDTAGHVVTSLRVRH